MTPTEAKHRFETELAHLDEMSLLNWKVRTFHEAQWRKPDARRKDKFTNAERYLIGLVDNRITELQYQRKCQEGVRVSYMKPQAIRHRRVA